MGKLRAKQRKKSGRIPRPTGLPSVKETEEDTSLEPGRQTTTTIPVLDKVPLIQLVCTVNALLRHQLFEMSFQD